MRRFISIAIIMVIISSLLLGTVCAEPGSTAKFKDMKASDWFAEAVVKLAGLNIIDGLPGGIFGPKNEVTRSQFVKMLVQAMDYQKIDSVSFDDIYVPTTKKPHWASVYIETALRNGVISKEETGNNFYPDIPIKRADMFMMMYRALKLESSAGVNPFADLTEANGSYTKLYEEYLTRGIIEDGKRLFKPFGHTTRAEAAVVIARMLEYKENSAKFVAKAAMEERFANGTYTEEDLARKCQIDLERQKQDNAYIPEPIIKYEYNPTKGYYIKSKLLNVNAFEKDCTFKVVCTNYNELNRMAHRDLRDQYVETDLTEELTAKEAGVRLIIVPKQNARLTGGKTEYYLYDFKPGTKFSYKLYIKRGKTAKVKDIILTVQ